MTQIVFWCSSIPTLPNLPAFQLHKQLHCFFFWRLQNKWRINKWDSCLLTSALASRVLCYSLWHEAANKTDQCRHWHEVSKWNSYRNFNTSSKGVPDIRQTWSTGSDREKTAWGASIRSLMLEKMKSPLKTALEVQILRIKVANWDKT